MSETQRLVYRGPANRALFLVALLELEGLTVRRQPSRETRGHNQSVVNVIELTVSGTATMGIAAASKAAVAKFKERFPRGAEIDEHDVQGDG
jgi:hypothetical protein